MKVSYNWLREWVDIPVDADTLAKELTMVGLQLQSMDKTGTDVILDFEITVNRPDCLSLIGVAREAGTIFNSPAPQLPKLLDSPVLRVDGKEGKYPAGGLALHIVLEDPELCPRYCGQIVMGVKVASSPKWLSDKLEACGVHTINNVVDVSNFVMLELGQPMHAFDCDHLSSGTIRVRRARGEQLKMIDGKERLLQDPMLVIADSQRAQAVGGVMGGFDSEVTERTSTVLLEAAYFQPASIRTTAKKLELLTDASYRFERGVDYDMQAIACRRAALLLQEIAGGKAHPVLDVCAKTFQARQIELRPARVERMLGQRIDAAFMNRTLQSLGFSEKDSNVWMVPSFRVDVDREIDLIEEIARHYGYNKFPDTLPPATRKYQDDYPTFGLERRVGEFLRSARIDETTTYSFVDPSRVPGNSERVKVVNPLSEAASELRSSLIPNLMEAVEYNLRHRNESVRLFEIGRVFLKQDEKVALGIVILGEYQELKGVIEGLFPALQYSSPVFQQNRILIDGCRLGEIQQTSVEGQPVQLCEIYLTDLVGLKKEEIRYEPIIPFPYVQRDVSFILDESIAYGDLEKLFQQLNVENLRSFKLVDRYHGLNLPAGKVSLTFQLVYQSAERTLTSEEVDRLHNRIIEEFSRRFSAELRK